MSIGTNAIMLAMGAAAPPSNSVLLLHMDGTNNSTSFTDSATGKTVTARGTAKIDTSQSKFGVSSLRVDGSAGCCITVADATDFHPAGDFTVDFWFMMNSASVDQGLFSKMNSASEGLLEYLFHGSAGNGFQCFLENQLSIDGISDAHDGVIGSVGSAGPTGVTGIWRHVAFVRSGSSYKSYLNGVLGDTFTSATALSFGASPLAIGALYNGTAFQLPMNGWIDEFRWANFAAWTSNFTPPTSPYTS